MNNYLQMKLISLLYKMQEILKNKIILFQPKVNNNNNNKRYKKNNAADIKYIILI